MGLAVIQQQNKQILAQNAWIISALRYLVSKEQAVQASLDAIAQAVAAEKTIDQSAITLLQQLSAQIAALAQQPTVNPADVQALADQISANAKTLSDAVVANTPAAPVP